MPPELNEEQLIESSAPAPTPPASEASPPPPAESPAPAPKTLREELSSAIKSASNPPADQVKPAVDVKTAPIAEAPKPAEVEKPAPAPAPTEGPRLSNYLKSRHGEEWDKLPPKVQETMLGYESRIGQLTHKYGTAAKEYEGLQQVFAPYEEMVRSEGGTMATAMQSLLETARILRQGHPAQRAALVQTLIDTFQVPVKIVQAEGPAGDAANAPPELISRITQLEQQLLTQQARGSYAARTQVKETVESFLADPQRPYVREEGFLEIMADLVDVGRAKDISEAYDMAAMLHPVTQARELAKRQTAETERLKEEARRRQEAASLTIPSRNQVAAPREGAKSTLREELEAAFRGGSI